MKTISHQPNNYFFTISRSTLSMFFGDVAGGWLSGFNRKRSEFSRIAVSSPEVIENIRLRHKDKLSEDDVVINLNAILITQEKRPAIFVGRHEDSGGEASVCFENIEGIETIEGESESPSHRLIVQSTIAHCLTKTLAYYFVEDGGRLSFAAIASTLGIPEISLTFLRGSKDVFAPIGLSYNVVNEVKMVMAVCVDRHVLYPEPVFSAIDWLTIEEASEAIFKSPTNFSVNTRQVFGLS